LIDIKLIKEKHDKDDPHGGIVAAGFWWRRLCGL
jgi:hypothetical protein